jgi:hypothetical protein
MTLITTRMITRTAVRGPTGAQSYWRLGLPVPFNKKAKAVLPSSDALGVDGGFPNVNSKPPAVSPAINTGTAVTFAGCARRLGEDACRECELAFGSCPLMLFGNAFDAVTGIVGIVVRRGNEITNLIRAEGRCSKPLRHEVDDLADIELVSHETSLS